MARAIWTGAISFALVTVPVKPYTATDSHRVSFHQFREGTGERIRHERVLDLLERKAQGEDVVVDREEPETACAC